MSEKIICTVTDEKRAAIFVEVFGTNEVVIVSPLTELANLPGLGQQLVYKLDLAAITAGQRIHLVSYLAKQFGLDAAEVGRDLDATGMPILAEGCMVTIPQGIALSMMGDGPDFDLPDYDDDDWESDYFDDEGSFESRLSECGMTHGGFCMQAGTEYCDWECDIDWSYLTDDEIDESAGSAAPGAHDANPDIPF